jgi:hypothetical protein
MAYFYASRLLLAALVVAVASASPDAHVCLQFGLSSAGSIYYDIQVDASGTVLKRYNMATNPPTFVDTNWYASLQMPQSGSMWNDGVAYAATMQTRHVWVNTEPTSAAYWERDSATGQDTWRFETTIYGGPVTLTFRTSQCTLNASPATQPPPTTTAAAAFNCASSTSASGLNCDGSDVCCGAGSSAPQCCSGGAACCVSTGYSEFHTCCSPGTVCCQKRYNPPQCCTVDQVCGSFGEGCISQSTSAPAVTNAPAAFNCASSTSGSGLNCGGNDVCCGAGSSAPECCSGGAACCVSTGYSEFHTCCSPGTVCCQKRYNPPQCCTVDQVCGSFGEGCMSQSTSAPAATNAPGTVAPTSTTGTHVCLQFGLSSAGSIYYDIQVDASGTVLKRYNMATNPPTFIDTNWYASLRMPPSGSVWNDGVAYAATMQSRNVWVNTEPTSAAYWHRDSATGQDTWRFETTIYGGPVTLTFRTTQCTL